VRCETRIAYTSSRENLFPIMCISSHHTAFVGRLKDVAMKFAGLFVDNVMLWRFTSLLLFRSLRIVHMIFLTFPFFLFFFPLFLSDFQILYRVIPVKRIFYFKKFLWTASI